MTAKGIASPAPISNRRSDAAAKVQSTNVRYTTNDSNDDAVTASTGSSGGLTSASAADCRVRLAKTLVELRETEAAIGELISAHAINPSNDVAMSMLVDLYTSIGDDAKAEKFRVALEGLANA